MGLLIGGVVVAVVGVILWFIKGKRLGQSAALELTDTSTVSEINENYKSITDSLGSGNFTHYCEVKGVAHSETPVKAELSEEKVVYYKSTVEHKFERLEEKRESNGTIRKRWVKRSEVVSTNEFWADGWGVKDDTGFIKVDPAKAKLHTQKLMQKFEPGENPRSGLNVNLGGMNIGFGTSNYRSLGYDYEEHGIRLNTDLYVIGDANDRDGELRISRPQDKSQPFMVSTKSEDELVSGLASAAKRLSIGAYICWGLGGALIVAGILQALKVF